MNSPSVSVQPTAAPRMPGSSQREARERKPGLSYKRRWCRFVLISFSKACLIGALSCFLCCECLFNPVHGVLLRLRCDYCLSNPFEEWLLLNRYDKSSKIYDTESNLTDTICANIVFMKSCNLCTRLPRT
ncbi:hypothetical protein AG1IA_05907 [Rhizoctonia solani AG-1 IA]|uniref:Uncharacterized protein n=1 Tax=Thanatephorus cucumeris (strain AG1-IA) TaxID=983506 RepID=L8WUP9_THACA|nr:hypothetical protein AG1IA_05907 [Rhizoctonia solani AG-1 IA]